MMPPKRKRSSRATTPQSSGGSTSPISNQESQLKTEKQQQIALPPQIYATPDAALDLFHLFLTTGTPVHMINHPSVHSFMLKYFKEMMPPLKEFRSSFLEPTFKEKRENLRNMLKDEDIYLVVRNDVHPHYGNVVTLMIGILDGRPTKSHLYSFCLRKEHDSEEKQRKSKNNKTTFVLQEIMSAIHSLWSEGLQFDKLKLLVTENTPLMMDTAAALGKIFPEMKHISCLLHMLDEICNEFRANNPLLDEYVDTVTRIFITYPKIAAEFKSKLSIQFSLEQGSILSGTEWLKAVCTYFNGTRILLELLPQIGYNTTSLNYTEKLIGLMKKSELQEQLINLSGYQSIPLAYEKLSSLSLSVPDQQKIIETLGRRPRRSALIKTVSQYLERNPDYKQLTYLQSLSSKIESQVNEDDKTEKMDENDKIDLANGDSKTDVVVEEQMKPDQVNGTNNKSDHVNGDVIMDNDDKNKKDAPIEQEVLSNDLDICYYAPLVTREASNVFRVFQNLSQAHDSVPIEAKDLEILTFLLYSKNI